MQLYLDQWTIADMIPALSSLIDLVLALFPINLVWKLRIRPRQKIGICCVMGLGVL